MKASNLFLLIVSTAFCAFLFMTGMPELCAVGFLFGIFCVYGWYYLIRDISKW